MEAEETEEEEAVYFMQCCLIWLTLHICKNLLRPKNIEAVWGWGSHANSLGPKSSTRPKPLVHLSGFLGCCSHKNRKWLFAHLAVLFLPCFNCYRVCPTCLRPSVSCKTTRAKHLPKQSHHFFFLPSEFPSTVSIALRVGFLTCLFACFCGEEEVKLGDLIYH